MKAVIIDDERQSRSLLRKMVTDYCEGVKIIGEAQDVRSGIALLQELRPDLIFLDIEMPNGNGFNVLDAFGYAHFNVVFVTGYDQFAIKAIKYAALDYLLKPIDLQELQLTIGKLTEEWRKGNPQGRLKFLRQQYEDRHQTAQQIILPGRDQHVIVALDDILRIEAKGSYVNIHLDDGKIHLVVNSLSHYENLLPSQTFFRIHKSHLINIQKIARFDAGRSSRLQLVDGTELDIAARRKAAFNQILKKLRGV